MSVVYLYKPVVKSVPIKFNMSRYKQATTIRSNVIDRGPSSLLIIVL